MTAPASRAWPRAVLFDLDGTLIDSAPDIHAAVNDLLARHGLGPLGLSEVVAMIGNGVKKLVERAFAAAGHPLEGEALDKAYVEMMGVYGDHLTEFTTLMPGARETVEALAEAGIGIAVATNKPQRATEAILDHFGFSPFLGAAIGGDAGVEKKPAPDMLFAALELLRAEPWDALMVGDSPADVEAARAAGVAIAVIRGGYTNVPVDALGADRVLDSLADLPDAIAAMAAERVDGGAG